MAKFTKQVEFNAYQFNPAEIEHLEAWDVENVIMDALCVPDGVRSADLIRGQLHVVLYVYGAREAFCLDPGDWLVAAHDATTFEAVTDEHFKGFATPAE